MFGLNNVRSPIGREICRKAMLREFPRFVAETDVCQPVCINASLRRVWVCLFRHADISLDCDTHTHVCGATTLGYEAGKKARFQTQSFNRDSGDCSAPRMSGCLPQVRYIFIHVYPLYCDESVLVPRPESEAGIPGEERRGVQVLTYCDESLLGVTSDRVQFRQ